MSGVTINVRDDFSPYPGSRKEEASLFSGEAFRNECLLPALDIAKRVTVELDGTQGYGSSWLEEAFGGVVRDGYDPSVILLVSEDAELINEINDYIREAKERKEAQNVVN